MGCKNCPAFCEPNFSVVIGSPKDAHSLHPVTPPPEEIIRMWAACTRRFSAESLVVLSLLMTGHLLWYYAGHSSPNWAHRHVL